jgi:hypothetical protein
VIILGTEGRNELTKSCKFGGSKKRARHGQNTGRSNTENESKERKEEEQDIVSNKRIGKIVSVLSLCQRQGQFYINKYVVNANGEMRRLEKIIVSIFESGES